jgi:hypothetical protein
VGNASSVDLKKNVRSSRKQRKKENFYKEKPPGNENTA